MDESALCLRPLVEADLPALSAIQREAFDEDSLLHLGRRGGPKGYDDGSFLHRWALHPDATALTVELDGRIAGGVILFLREAAGEGFLGCLFLSPALRGQGLGLRVWRAVESRYPAVRCWRTETPAFSHRNHHFYINKCGFQVVAVTDPKDWENAQFQLCKRLA